ncbi:hypothetical protein DNH61_24050 [Paenibacillus sambharensis]|uniref:Uncharacterized protein n=1 Tax=Paenibacillus sambharensis TaxID=1803190 RepID=A0A2W1L180_9BACL|nr:glucosaminidase domain-containing protein [Paenibacillus sambharensis]PZD93688.1 hypothetical protein DNH61_24050 [Paenibacillus sambharensis]
MAEDEASILTMEEIGNIRRYVRGKYKELPPSRQADIIADAIKRAIYLQLPELPVPSKQELADILIRSVVAAEQRSVRPGDVLAAALKLPIAEEVVDVPLRRWLVKQSGVNLSEESAGHLLHNLRDFLQTSTDPEVLWRHVSQPLQEVAATAEAQAAGNNDDLSPVQTGGITKSIRAGKSAAVTAFFLLLFTGLSLITLLYGWNSPVKDLDKKPGTVDDSPTAIDSPVYPAPTSYYKGNELPAGLRYTLVNEEKLKLYLKKRSSLLAESPYFEAIINAAQVFDIHPLLLFAITGQEQGFVPHTNKSALQIANNPFNVYHSWQDFNTDISDSAAIAARTIVRLSRDKPDNVEPIRWLNRQYAEDPNWHKGVTSIFASMQAFVQE